MKTYLYVGPEALYEAARDQPAGHLITSPSALAAWLAETGQAPGRGRTAWFTCVVQPDQRLYVAPRGTEHVACAARGPVLAAGELEAEASGQITAITNLSTGYCPPPECFQAIEGALISAGFEAPTAFSPAFDFRRCEACGERNVIKDDWWVCAVCEANLPAHWNLDAADEPTPLTSRLAGGLEGLLIGDALGVPYEFHPPEALPPQDQLEMIPPPGFARSHQGTPPGTWSDDGAQALCLLDSLRHTNTLDVEDLAQRLVAWAEAGHLAVDGRVFDIGVGTAEALRRIHNGIAPLEAARRDPHANGNGALMRVLPLALWHQGDDASLVQAAHLQTRITHGHPRAAVCSALYVLWARRLLADHPTAWADAVKALRHLYAADEAHQEQLEFYVRPDDPIEGRGTGYVVDSLRSARMLLEQHGTFEAVVRGAIALGHDTDTTAAIAGGLAGLRHGLAGLPARWRRALRGRTQLQPLMASLMARPASGVIR